MVGRGSRPDTVGGWTGSLAPLCFLPYQGWALPFPSPYFSFDLEPQLSLCSFASSPQGDRLDPLLGPSHSLINRSS